jgi:hypothetical protein
MTEFQVMILVFFILVAVAFTLLYKLKQTEKRINELLKQEKDRQIEEQRLARIRHRESRLAEFKAAATPKTPSGFVQPVRVTSKSVSPSYASSPTPSAPAPVVVHNSSNDMLTAMIIQDSLNSSHYKTPTTHYTNTDNPIDFPVSTSEPSYNSSSNSDSSSSSDSSNNSN